MSGEKRAASTFKLCIHNLDNSNMIKLMRQLFYKIYFTYLFDTSIYLDIFLSQ